MIAKRTQHGDSVGDDVFALEENTNANSDWFIFG